jgi:hypothetical protein
MGIRYKVKDLEFGEDITVERLQGQKVKEFFANP